VRVRSVRGLPVAVGAAAVALAIGTLGACSAHGSGTASAQDGKRVPAGGSTVSPQPPGKYQTLPQPCAAVDQDSLQQLVPGAADYAGTEALTYDTDRRVGCSWRGRASDGTTRSLSVDLVRVVSYDPRVSDEVQAEMDFDQQATAAQIPLSPTDTPSDQAGAGAGTAGAGGSAAGGGTTKGTSAGGSPGSGSAGGQAGGDSAGGGSSGGSASGSPGGGGSTDAANGSPDLAPRALTDVGNGAFLNDVAKGRSRRDVTVVFRTANVLVTVVYSETVPKGAPQPQSADLQQGAQDVATQLEHKVGR
jgi:hypothetical protein